MKDIKKFEVYQLQDSSIKRLTGGAIGGDKKTETHAHWSKETARDRDNDVETKPDDVAGVVIG